MKKLITKIALILSLIGTSFSANAWINVYNDGWNGGQYAVSMPSGTIIAVLPNNSIQWIVAPHYYPAPQGVNDDITAAYSYAIANHYSWRWGRCYSSSKPPCLY
jgi:hypothetical protein